MLSIHDLSFRRDLQGLRAIAILLVLFAHSGSSILSGGFVGVDVFFVLSGYLITGLLLRELEQTGKIALMSFYARRMKRLLPALIFMMIISSGLAIWFLSEAEARSQLASSSFSATWTSNLYFSFSEFDYFDELSGRDLFLHTWSLGVEEQFYLIWPAALLLLFWLAKKMNAKNNNAFSLMLPGLAVTFILSLILSLYWTAASPRAAFYLMPSRIWQFSLGAIIFCCIFRSESINKIRLNKISSMTFSYLILGSGLTLIIGSAVMLSPNIAYPGLWALVPSFGTALIIIAGHIAPKDSRELLSHPILVWLGDRSYSLYLWHWPILTLGFSMGLQGQTLPTLNMILLSMLAAIVSFRLIEFPFWKGNLSQAKPLRVLLVSVVVMAASILAIQHEFHRSPDQSKGTDISNQWRRDLPKIYHYPCDAWYAHSRVEPCVFGGNTAKKTVLFLSDSIGGQWFSMMPELFSSPDWRVVVLTKSSCPMVDEDYYYQRIGKTYQVCADWRNAILDELTVLKPDVVVMGSAATYGFNETQWVEGSSRILGRMKTIPSVIIISGTPNLGFDGPGCVSRHLSPDGHIDREKCLVKDRIQESIPVARFLEKAANRYPNVSVLNLNDLVCPKGSCNAISEEGAIVFRDTMHLTDSFVRSQVPEIRERLKRIYSDDELPGSPF